MITILYTIGIHLYTALIRLAAMWNGKARQWLNGRRKIWSQLAAFQKNQPAGQSVIWIHCASLGEFEQGRPLIERLKEEIPSTYIVLTFFSPSGYEIRKDYALADLICYLPVDTPGNARRFVSVLQPEMAIFVKYEFWRNHLYALQEADVPILLVSAIFRPGQLFFQPYGFWYRNLLKVYDHIFVQDQPSLELLRTHGVLNAGFAGDTRVDRVLQLREQATGFPEVARFTGSAPVWIAGSTWPPDEQLLLPFFAEHLPPNWRIILAPHDIAEEHISRIEQQSSLPTVRYSRLAKAKSMDSEVRILIIDNIGMLSALYQYGRIAYIGGGFGKAIHNLLEPIAFGLPVIFGPKHQKFQEAVKLKTTGGGFAIENAEELLSVFHRLQEEPAYRQASRQAFGYLQQSKGSTEKILKYILRNFSEN